MFPLSPMYTLLSPILKFQLFAVPLSLDNIYEEVMKNEVGRSMTLDRVEASLSALGCPGMDDYKISMFTHCWAKSSQHVYFSHFWVSLSFSKIICLHRFTEDHWTSSNWWGLSLPLIHLVKSTPLLSKTWKMTCLGS